MTSPISLVTEIERQKTQKTGYNHFSANYFIDVFLTTKHERL